MFNPDPSLEPSIISTKPLQPKSVCSASDAHVSPIHSASVLTNQPRLERLSEILNDSNDGSWFKFTLKKIIVLIMAFTFSTNAIAAKTEKAILAGGCFWGMQQLLSELDGVLTSKVGYAGGTIPNPTYELVSTGITNYAESVEVIFDPQKISYEKLLKFFFTIHNPTTVNRQENDVGNQYRSEIFYFNNEQKNIALDVIAQANKSGVFKKPVVTNTSLAGKFYPAEEYHQNYLKKNPYGYTCHHARDEWKF